jgi:2-polyprenyl-6-methoxyphenol hydroxylase-like FAD-dependent oxidoreductase
LGRALLKHGIRAVLYERNAVAENGYGITLHASSYRPLLDLLDMDESTFRRTVAVDSLVGGTGAINPASMLHPEAIAPSSFRAHRKYLERLLREGLDIRWKHKIDGVRNSATGTVLCLQRRKEVTSDCIIGIDGVHSSVRKSILPHSSPTTLPFVAYYGRRRVPRAVWDSEYAPFMHSSNLVQTRHDDIVLQLQVNHQNEGSTRIGWIYSRPAHGPTDTLHRPDRLVSDATMIPEDFFQEISVRSSPVRRRSIPRHLWLSFINSVRHPLGIAEPPPTSPHPLLQPRPPPGSNLALAHAHHVRQHARPNPVCREARLPDRRRRAC